ncbi:MAG: thioredoxin, partial [Ectothiorhodospiraceae bacterium]|nr:thioredoxin [Ectothiorhodospiraceae bacterium]
MSTHSIDVTRDNFEAQVIQGSMQRPVVADFWAEWCGPCKMLMPLLGKLADEYGGGFLLAKVNTDEEQDLARLFAIRSIPTVKVFRNGQVVDEFMGVQSEPAIRAIIDRHLSRPTDSLLDAARAAFAQGDVAAARAQLEQARALAPDDHAIAVDLVRVLLAAGEATAAAGLLETLPLDVQMQDEVKAMMSMLHFSRIVGEHPDPQALAARLRNDPADPEALQGLAAHCILTGDYDSALDMLMLLMQKHRAFGDEAGRKGLLAAFEVMGPDDPRVASYRRRMFTLL